MNENNKFKDFSYKLKEAWDNPRKKAGIKLLGYLIFFFILFLLAAITSYMDVSDNSNKMNTTTTTKAVDKYTDKQKSLLKDKYNISYVININENEYKINGTLNNNIITGYLETKNGIKKIIIKDNIYEVVNEQEILLESELDINIINLENILNTIKQSKALIDIEEETTLYTYNLNDNNVAIKVNDSHIYEIKVTNDTYSYILNFDI